MKRWMLLVLVGALSVQLVAGGTGLPELSIVEPTWDSVEGSTVEAKKLWRAALALVRDDLATTVKVVEGSRGARIRVNLSGQSGAYTALFQLEGVASAPGAMKYLPFTRWEPGLVVEWARALEALARPLIPHQIGPAPVLLDDFSLADLQSVDLPLTGSYLQPYGLTVRNGRLLVACGSAVLEFDSRWQVTGLPAKALTDEGQVNFAWGLTLTPAGTLFVRSVDGSGVWALAEGASRPVKVRIAVPAGSAFGVLGDGSPFSVSMQTKAAQIWRGGAATVLSFAADSAVLAAASGPDNTLWTFDAVRSSVRIQTPEGLLRDVIYPEMPVGTTIMKLKVLDDGSFLAATGTDLRRFDRQGRTTWIWDGREEGLSLTYSLYTDLAPGPEGVLYFNDYLGKKVYRLAEDPGRLGTELSRVAAAYRAAQADSRKPEPFLALANAYGSWGAWEAERAALDRYLELRPADGAAVDRRLAVQVSLLKLRAGSGENDVAEQVKRFGPETARDAYGRAMKTLEGVRALSPQDTEVPRRMAALRKLLDDAQGPAPAREVPQVVRVDLAALFPSLLQAYRSRPAGTLTLKNTLARPLTDVRVELYLPKYMDYPSAGPSVARLAPGAEARLDLTALLNDRVLDVEEDVPVQVLVTVKFQDGAQTGSFEFPRPITLYRKSALTWDDTGKLASFVTPNEDTVAKAAFQFLPPASSTPAFSSTVQRASALADALGALPLRYVPDPQTAFGDVLADVGLIDTVRFPRTTLAYQGGDCDDTTALLASLLEASGIRTAIVTSPGHVFLAFDTGEKPEAAWLFDAPGYKTWSLGGTLWIPVETTVLTRGFAHAWRTASELLTRYGGTPELEFLPLATLRASYPALPLPPSVLPAPRPDTEAVRALQKTSSEELTRTLFEPVTASLEAARAGKGGAVWAKATNRLAQAQARFGSLPQATATLKSIVARDKAYVPAYLNLAVLSLQAGGKSDALAWIKAAQTAAPGSAQVAAFAAQAGFDLGGPLIAQGADATAGRAGTEALPPWSGD